MKLSTRKLSYTEYHVTVKLSKKESRDFIVQFPDDFEARNGTVTEFHYYNDDTGWEKKLKRSDALYGFVVAAAVRSAFKIK